MGVPNDSYVLSKMVVKVEHEISSCFLAVLSSCDCLKQIQSKTKLDCFN